MKSSFYINALSYLRIGLRVDENFDAIEKKIKRKSKEYNVFFLTTLTNSIEVMTIAESLILSTSTDIESKLYNGPIGKSSDLNDLLRLALSGVAILLLPNKDYALTIETRNYNSRSTTESDSEKSIRGSKDGFNESINDNLGLIRRRIRSKDFVIKLFSVGEKSKCDVGLIYIDGVTDKEYIDELSKRINEVHVESLVMSDRALEEKIFPQRFNPFPLVRYTERPDIASINLMRGKALIVVDTSPSVIMTPTTIFDHAKNVEEYRQSPLVGSFTKFLRNLAIILSVILIPLWYCLVQETNISNFFVIRPSEVVDMPIILQIVIAELFVEFIRLAVVHTPSPLTSTIGVVAAIIMGSVSIELKIFLPEVLVYVSFSSIASFATPSYELSQANRLVKYFLLILSWVLGRNGFLLGLLFIFCYLAHIKVLGKYYLYPLLPFDGSKILKVFYRKKADDKRIV